MKAKIHGVRIPYLFIAIIVVVTALFIWKTGNSFNEDIFSLDNVRAHIKELASAEYAGRLAGSEGNSMALGYIEESFINAGVSPAGSDGTFYQYFSTIIPAIDPDPVFKFSEDSGQTLMEFVMYEDYILITSMNGGEADFFGEIILAGNNIYSMDPGLIRDRVVVVDAFRLDISRINYVIQNGGKGIFCSSDYQSYGWSNKYEEDKTLGIEGKTGDSVIAGYLSGEAYGFMLGLIGDDAVDEVRKPIGIIKNARIKVSMEFPVVRSANILGKIDGRAKNGRILLITANIDGAGTGINGKYFPGAMVSASGPAILLETARVIAAQENLPYETIIFAGWNGQMQQSAGSSYYADNPLYPLDKTTLIHLGTIGESTLDGLIFSSDSIQSGILRDKFSNYSEDLGIKSSASGPAGGPTGRFADKRIPSVELNDAVLKQNTYADTYENIDTEAVDNASRILLEYIKRDVFKDTLIDYLNKVDIATALVIMTGLAVNYLISRFYRTNPNLKIGGVQMEKIYYSNTAIILRKAVLYVFPVILAIFMLVFIANIDPSTNVKIINNAMETNFSGYLILKKSIVYFKDLVTPDAEAFKKIGEMAGIALKSSYRSLILLVSSLVLSLLIGIGRGIYEAYRSKRSNSRSIGTLVVFSIPDVLVVLAGLLLYVYIARKFPAAGELLKLREFMLPLVTLSIIPTIYVSRITFITFQDELKMDYVRNAKARGLSKGKVFFSEMLPASVFRLVDSMPAIMTMLLSNLIIVEYLFNYLGIVNYLIYFHKSRQVDKFITLAVTLGVIYILFTWGIRLLAASINPLKREAGK
ncbi:MAG: ABC transporter permease subunit [Clostridia bacterium]|nr:ABC transporter permease subunit [Clostridia bacterium]